MEIRTDRKGVLIEQLTDAVELSKARCVDLTDDEYLWEPVEGMWSLRQRDHPATAAAFGPGEWVLDRELIDPFAPGPLTTIAWRVGHLLHGFAARYEWTFGPRQTDPAAIVEFSPESAEALTTLWAEAARWAEALETLTDEQLDQTGFGQYPWGLDRQLPFVGIVRWVNREFIHHMAEIGLLRDLYDRRDQLVSANVTH